MIGGVYVVSVSEASFTVRMICSIQFSPFVASCEQQVGAGDLFYPGPPGACSDCVRNFMKDMQVS